MISIILNNYKTITVLQRFRMEIVFFGYFLTNANSFILKLSVFSFINFF